MKRIGLILSLVLLFGLCSCSSTASESTTTIENKRGGSELVKDDNVALFDGTTKYYLRGNSESYILVSKDKLQFYSNDRLVNEINLTIIGEHFFIADKTYYIDNDVVYALWEKSLYYTTKVLS